MIPSAETDRKDSDDVGVIHSQRNTNALSTSRSRPIASTDPMIRGSISGSKPNAPQTIRTQGGSLAAHIVVDAAAQVRDTSVDEIQFRDVSEGVLMSWIGGASDADARY